MTTTSTAPKTTSESPSLGVTEMVKKPIYRVSGNADVYEVQIEMPGVAKSGVKIDLDQQILNVRGERGAATTFSGWKPLHRELSSQNYHIRLRLNSLVDPQKMTAEMENGLLTLKLPLKEKAKPRQIQVQ